MANNLYQISTVHSIRMTDEGIITYKIWLDYDDGRAEIDPNIILKKADLPALGISAETLTRGTKIKLGFSPWRLPPAEEQTILQALSLSSLDLWIKNIVKFERRRPAHRYTNKTAWFDLKDSFLELETIQSTLVMQNKAPYLRFKIHLADTEYDDCLQLSCETLFRVKPF